MMPSETYNNNILWRGGESGGPRARMGLKESVEREKDWLCFFSPMWPTHSLTYSLLFFSCMSSIFACKKSLIFHLVLFFPKRRSFVYTCSRVCRSQKVFIFYSHSSFFFESNIFFLLLLLSITFSFSLFLSFFLCPSCLTKGNNKKRGHVGLHS